MTEWISGVNIPSCQLMIGMGVPLHRIPDIRRLFAKDPRGTSTIDFDNDPQIEPSGTSPEPARLSHAGNRGVNCYPCVYCTAARGFRAIPSANSCIALDVLLKAARAGAACHGWGCRRKMMRTRACSPPLALAVLSPSIRRARACAFLRLRCMNVNQGQHCLQGTLWR